MKHSALIRSLIVTASLLLVGSCAPNEQESSIQISTKSENQSSSSVEIDPNYVVFPTLYTIDEKVNSKLSVRVEYEIDGTYGEINLTHYNQYIKYEDSNNMEDNCFAINDSGRGLFYNKDEEGRYTSFTCDDIFPSQYYRNAYVGWFAGNRATFKSNQEITYLGRSCIKYTNKEELNDSTEGSLILDKETGLVLHCDIDKILENLIYDQIPANFKFDVKEIYVGEDARNNIIEDIENVYANPLDSTTLEKLGFKGELETPNFAISDCSTKWQGENLIEYAIEYKDRVNSGNDTYINQFETFTTCLYNMGFKQSSDSSDKNYEELVVDSTIDYDADLSFTAYAIKDSATYKTTTNITVKGGYASLKFTLIRIY